MKIVISSHWFPVCVAVYLARAARRLGHEVVTVGPYSCKMPWPDMDPENDHSEFVVVPDVAKLRFWWDLWIDVHGGWFAGPMSLPREGRRVLVVTDPHVGDEWRGDEFRRYVDRVYMMQLSYVRTEAGDVWLPYGFDPEWHAPQDVEENHDVTNLGASYDERVEISDRLRAGGLKVLGPGRGPIGHAYSKLLCRAPVAIVWPLKDDIPARVFEALACHRVVLTPAIPGLDLCFGKDGVPWLPQKQPKTPEQFAAAVLHVMPNLKALLPAIRAAAGHSPRDRWGNTGNSWDDRLRTILSTEFGS